MDKKDVTMVAKKALLKAPQLDKSLDEPTDASAVPMLERQTVAIQVATMVGN